MKPDRKVDLKAGWNKMEIEMRGQLIRVWVNGTLVLGADLGRQAGEQGALAAVRSATPAL